MTDHPIREPLPADPRLDRTDPAGEPAKHPDSPGAASVDEELTEPTRDSMRDLGQADLDDEMDPAATEEEDESSPGQNSAWLPQ